MSTDKKSFFVDAKRVIGMQSKKEKMINSGLKKTTQKAEDWATRIPLKTRTKLCRWQLEPLVLHCMAVPGFVPWSASLIVQNSWVLTKSVENNLK